ncbi:response regulator [Neotamlana laminarinivorans]|uniref:Response regulator n=1 Tax=Neotamlana laminarinivorans TaxID=2883124 RepID=A0A9X1L3M0_9FLAO|nr:response regulator [Tamlana laminarinivorans]MCB4797411.1 response regulator [Tamlana laminarinivorans]
MTKKAVNICIIDDDEIYQFTAIQTLKKIDIEKNVTSFYDGEEAFNFFLDNINTESNLPDVILLDINMPVMDGFQFMDAYVKLKSKIKKNITIYMVSSSVDPADMKKVEDYKDIIGYIVKPMKRGDLLTKFEDLQEKGVI